MIAMLLLMAATGPQGAQVTAVAAARIVSGVRISLAEQKVQDAMAEPQRHRVVREEAGHPQPLHLVEFQ